MTYLVCWCMGVRCQYLLTFYLQLGLKSRRYSRNVKVITKRLLILTLETNAVTSPLHFSLLKCVFINTFTDSDCCNDLRCITPRRVSCTSRKQVLYLYSSTDSQTCSLQTFMWWGKSSHSLMTAKSEYMNNDAQWLYTREIVCVLG